MPIPKRKKSYFYCVNILAHSYIQEFIQQFRRVLEGYYAMTEFLDVQGINNKYWCSLASSDTNVAY